MNMETREKLVYETITTLTGIPAYRYCYLRRGMAIAKILKGIINPVYFSLLEKEKYRKDFRDIKKFARDRVTSTLIEDFFQDFSELVLSEKLTRIGCDNDNIIHNNPITSKPDFICSSDGSLREIATNFTGMFYEQNIMRFRDQKLLNLIKKSNRQKIYVIAIDTLYKQFQLIPINEGIEYEELDSIPQFGGKPGHKIKLKKELWEPLNCIPDYESILLNRYIKIYFLNHKYKKANSE